MASEQAEGRLDKVGPWTDVFGLGAMLYEILTGRPPFAGLNTLDELDRAQRGEIVRPSDIWSTVPRDLEAACLRALAKEPSDRYASAAELEELGEMVRARVLAASGIALEWEIHRIGRPIHDLEAAA